MKRWATNSATVGETGRAPVLIAVAPSLTRISFFRARACCSVSSVTGPILFRTRCRITAPSGDKTSTVKLTYQTGGFFPLKCKYPTLSILFLLLLATVPPRAEHTSCFDTIMDTEDIGH